jgi:hypothetical protein
MALVFLHYNEIGFEFRGEVLFALLATLEFERRKATTDVDALREERRGKSLVRVARFEENTIFV